MKWKSALGEFVKAQLERENKFDKFAFAVKKYDVVVGHLSKGKAGQFCKNYFIFSWWKQW